MGSLSDFEDLLCVDEESDEKYERMEREPVPIMKCGSNQLQRKNCRVLSRGYCSTEKNYHRFSEKTIRRNGKHYAINGGWRERAEEKHDEFEKSFSNDDLLGLGAFMELDSYEIDSDTSGGSSQINDGEKFLESEFVHHEHGSSQRKRREFANHRVTIAELEFDYDEEDYPQVSAEVDEEAIRKAAGEATEKSTFQPITLTAATEMTNEEKKEKFASVDVPEEQNRNINGSVHHSRHRFGETHQIRRPLRYCSGPHSQKLKSVRSEKLLGSRKSHHSSRGEVRRLNFQHRSKKESPSRQFIHKGSFQGLNPHESGPSCSTSGSYCVNGNRNQVLVADSELKGYVQRGCRETCYQIGEMKDRSCSPHLQEAGTSNRNNLISGNSFRQSNFISRKKELSGQTGRKCFMSHRRPLCFRKENTSKIGASEKNRNVSDVILNSGGAVKPCISASKKADDSDKRSNCRKEEPLSFLLLNYNNNTYLSPDGKRKQRHGQRSDRNSSKKAALLKPILLLESNFHDRMKREEDNFNNTHLSVTLVDKCAENVRRIVQPPLSRIPAVPMVENLYSSSNGATEKNRRTEMKSLENRRRWVVTTDLIDKDVPSEFFKYIKFL